MAIAFGQPAVDRDEGAIAIAAVDEMVAVGNVLGEHRAVAGPHHRLAIVLDQPRLAIEDDDELVDALVPVALARDPAGLDDTVGDTNVLESARGSQPPEMALPHLRRERHRISRSVGLLDCVEIDLRHRALACWWLREWLFSSQPDGVTSRRRGLRRGPDRDRGRDHGR